MTDPWPRLCSGCGREYDARDRGIKGPFHFHVASATPESDDRHRLVGHWRSGLWNPQARLTLLRKDGAEVPIDEAQMQDDLPPTARQRGQGVVVIRAGNPKAVQAGGCVVEATP